MTRLLTILLFLMPTLSIGQVISSDDMIVMVNTPLTISYTKADDLTQPRVIHNAIEIQLKPKSYTRNILANLNFYNTSPADIPDNWIMLRLVNNNVSNAIVSATQVPLSTSPVLLFTQNAGNGDMGNLTISYDLVINPLTTFMRTGNYDFSITITSVAP